MKLHPDCEENGCQCAAARGPIAQCMIECAELESVPDPYRESLAELARLRVQLENVASMARRLSYALKRAGTNDKLCAQCVDLLKRYDLGGSIIRAESSQEGGEGR